MVSSGFKKKPKERGRVHFILMSFIRALLVIAFLGAWSTGRWLVMFTAGIAFFVTFLPYFLHRIWKIKIPGEFEVMTILFIYGALFFGEVRGFYAQFWWWDVLLNLASALALGFVGLTIMYILYKDEVIDAGPFIVAVFAFSFAVAAGALWEVFEYSMDTFLGFNLQKSGLDDTMGDMVVNIIGAALVSAGGYVYIKHGKFNIVSDMLSKFIESNPKFFRKKSSRKDEESEEHVKKLISRGENEGLEFKSTLRTNIHTGEIDKNVEHAALKTLVAYLNSNGGTLLIGVADKGEITGIERDNFPNNDKMLLHFTNLIKSHIGAEYLPFLEFGLVGINGKSVLKIDCKQSDRHVFLKHIRGEEFYVRNGPSSAPLSGSSLIDYINNKFNNKSGNQ